MNTPSLPARVRVSELSNPPGEAVLNQLKRLELVQAQILENLNLEPEKVRLAVALAGGSPIGYAVRTARELTVVVSASWRGKGIEAALEQLLEPISLVQSSSSSSWSMLAPAAQICDPMTGMCEVPQQEGATSSSFVVLNAREDVPNGLDSEET